MICNTLHANLKQLPIRYPLYKLNLISDKAIWLLLLIFKWQGKHFNCYFTQLPPVRLYTQTHLKPINTIVYSMSHWCEILPSPVEDLFRGQFKWWVVAVSQSGHAGGGIHSHYLPLIPHPHAASLERTVGACTAHASTGFHMWSDACRLNPRQHCRIHLHLQITGNCFYLAGKASLEQKWKEGECWWWWWWGGG